MADSEENVIVEVSLPKATLQRLMGSQTCEPAQFKVLAVDHPRYMQTGDLVTFGTSGATLGFEDGQIMTFSWRQLSKDDGPVRACCEHSTTAEKREIERLTGALKSAHRTGHSYRRDLLHLQEIVSEIGALVGDTGEDTVLDCVRALRSRYNQRGRQLAALQLELDEVKAALRAIDEALDDFWRGSTQAGMQGPERVRALARYATARRDERDRLTDTLARLVKAMGARNNGPHTSPKRADESPAMGEAQRLLAELGVGPWALVNMPPSARRSSGPAASRSGAAPDGAPIAAAENGVLEDVRRNVLRARHVKWSQASQYLDSVLTLVDKVTYGNELNDRVLRLGIDVEMGPDGRARSISAPHSAPDLKQVKRLLTEAQGAMGRTASGYVSDKVSRAVEIVDALMDDEEDR